MAGLEGSGHPGVVTRSIALPQCSVTSAVRPVDLPLEVIADLAGEKKEKCGIFGIAGPADSVERCYYGLYALQHRGQESAGIAASDGQTIHAHTGMGLVAEVFGKQILKQLT